MLHLNSNLFTLSHYVKFYFFFSWFLLSAEIYQRFLFVEIASSMLLLSISLLCVDQQMSNIDFGFFIYMLALLTGLLNLFLYCFFGKFATHSFEKMIRCLYEFSWMNLSTDLQKYVIIMIINAQRPIFYHGFRIVTLNLETFTKVMKTAFTYYLVIIKIIRYFFLHIWLYFNNKILSIVLDV